MTGTTDSPTPVEDLLARARAYVTPVTRKTRSMPTLLIGNTSAPGAAVKS
jgi:hypothetical protein